MASRPGILEAPDDACGYLNGMKMAPFGCLEASEKCAIYYPTSSMAGTTTTCIDATLMPMITPPPQPSIVCCEPSGGDCIVQPTACVDNFGDCTSICSNDPMTLKCTTGAHRHCNWAHFESPLAFRNIEAPDAGLRPTDAPADGWFCGPAAIPIQHATSSHSKTMSVAQMSHVSISPTTTLSVTITLSKPGLDSGPSPPAAVVSEGTAHKDNAPDSDDCCFDEEDTSEPCYCNAPRARLQQRQAIGGSTNAASPNAALGDEISRGSAIVSTTYIGQTDRPPFIEATRPWNVVIPTAVATPTTPTGPRMWPLTPKGKSRLSLRGAIAVGVTVGGLCIIAICCVVREEKRNRPVSSQQQHSRQHQNELEMNGPQVHEANKSKRYLGYLENFTSMADHIADMSPPQVSPDYGDTRGQPDLAFEGQPGLAFGGQPGGEQPVSSLGRHQHVSPDSGETSGGEEDPEPQSDESLEREAYNKVPRASRFRRGRYLAYN